MVQITENNGKMPQARLSNGGRRVALRDVARLAGTNGSAASVVLNGTKSNTGVSEKTRERIIAAAHELGYEPNLHAQRLVKGGCSDMVALLPRFFDPGTHAHQLLQIQNLLAAQGYNVPVHARSSHSDSAELIQLLDNVCQQQPRAIVTGLPHSVIAERLGRYCKNGGIVVRYDANSMIEAEAFGDTVMFDVEDGIYQSARHLLDLGHRKLGIFNGGNYKWESAWISGYSRALAQYGLEVRDDWRFYGGNSSLGVEVGGASLAAQWLALPSDDRPTGLCVINDQAAAAFIAGIERAGLQVPRDVSVVGFDDLPIALYSRLQITTFAKPFHKIALGVVELLRGRVEGRFDESLQCRDVKGELRIRETTGLPP